MENAAHDPKTLWCTGRMVGNQLVKRQSLSRARNAPSLMLLLYMLKLKPVTFDALF